MRMVGAPSRRGGRSYHKQNGYPKLRDMVRAYIRLKVFKTMLPR
jgi:hypothetical protein